MNEMSNEARQLQEHLQKAPEHTATGLLLQVLSVAITSKPVNARRLPELRGSQRIYFSETPDEILASGRSTDPQKIPGTTFYVLTNANNDWKRNTCLSALRLLGFPPDMAKVVNAAFDKVCGDQNFQRGLL
jgi:negative modulator of initiation of replication